MKFTAYLTEDAMQFNLIPENDHEKRFIGILKDYTGSVTVSQAADLTECQAGFVRNFGINHSAVAITIHKEPAS